MRAMVFDGVGSLLRPAEVPILAPGPGQMRVKVEARGICRTDLHVIDGDLAHPKLPLILGHQIVGIVDAVGGDAGIRTDAVAAGREPAVRDAAAPRQAAVPVPAMGERIGVPWLGWTCGVCRYCLSGRENLCDRAKFTGYDLDGGFAEYALVDRRFAFPIPEGYPAVQAAPLLCAGLIGYRSLTMTGEAQRLGIYGFGSAAHIVTQFARHQGRRVFAFTRPGKTEAQAFARSVGAEWAGGTDEAAPEELDAAIIFAPAGELVPLALRAVAKGGVVVCGGIHMSDIPSFPYDILWGERSLRSVANLTRRDGEESLALAAQVPVTTHVEEFPLEAANEAIGHLRRGRIRGAAVLVPGSDSVPAPEPGGDGPSPGAKGGDGDH
ncbi:MAG: zinc-dependent alcohol dehydrogenase family protein [Thermoleophilia bacterium]|nr:zinc-dependent alcohol dehydrogenase family protein [Thermoleophilia bacterium]